MSLSFTKTKQLTIPFSVVTVGYLLVDNQPADDGHNPWVSDSLTSRWSQGVLEEICVQFLEAGAGQGLGEIDTWDGWCRLVGTAVADGSRWLIDEFIGLVDLLIGFYRILKVEVDG